MNQDKKRGIVTYSLFNVIELKSTQTQIDDVEFLIMKSIYIYIYIYIYILLDILVCGIAAYFYELCRIKYKLRVRILSDTTNLNVL